MIKVRFESDYILTLNFTKNGVVMIKPTRDEADFGVFFPLEILS